MRQQRLQKRPFRTRTAPAALRNSPQNEQFQLAHVQRVLLRQVAYLRIQLEVRPDGLLAAARSLCNQLFHCDKRLRALLAGYAKGRSKVAIWVRVDSENIAAVFGEYLRPNCADGRFADTAFATDCYLFAHHSKRDDGLQLRPSILLYLNSTESSHL